MDVYRGKFRFSKKELEEITRELEYRRSVVEQNGGRYYLVIPPLKAQIYPEYLPSNVSKVNPESCAQQLAAYLQQNSAIEVIDLLKPIKKKKAKTDTLLYLKTDHHWNQIASLFACQIIMDRLRKDFSELGKINFSDYDIDIVEYDGMSLADLLGLGEKIKESFPVVKPRYEPIAKDSARFYPPPHDFTFPDEYALAKWTGKQKLPSLFMVRDSYASHMIDVLAEHFESSFFLFDNWKHQFNREIFERENPDIYIQMIWEGILFSLLKNPPEGTGL